MKANYLVRMLLLSLTFLLLIQLPNNGCVKPVKLCQPKTIYYDSVALAVSNLTDLRTIEILWTLRDSIIGYEHISRNFFVNGEVSFKKDLSQAKAKPSIADTIKREFTVWGNDGSFYTTNDYFIIK